jgi:hypothetical protein
MANQPGGAMNYLTVGDRLINLDNVTRLEMCQETHTVKVSFITPTDRLILRGDDAQIIWLYVESQKMKTADSPPSEPAITKI